MGLERSVTMPVKNWSGIFSASCSCRGFGEVIEVGLDFNASSCWVCWWVFYLKETWGHFPILLRSLRSLLCGLIGHLRG